MNKRILCLLLVLAMMFSACAMLASCEKKNNEDEEIPVDDKDWDEADKGVSKYYKYTWSTKTLNVELSEHTCSQELISRVRRYLAGGDPSANDPIDQDVRRRMQTLRRLPEPRSTTTISPTSPPTSGVRTSAVSLTSPSPTRIPALISTSTSSTIWLVHRFRVPSLTLSPPRCIRARV